MKQIKSIKGMNDIVPAVTPVWQYLERVVASVASRYGYSEIRFPILEQTDLFKRSIGEVTDIVEKEMYTFDDRKGLSMTMRPEGTACCVRAAEEQGLLYNQTQKLWYTGPMFRYERPQKGRLRQFHQFGLEAFGMSGPDVDAELIILTFRLWQELGIHNAVTLQLNNLGTADIRKKYSQDLVVFLSERKELLDPDSQNRLSSNPLRILDSKVQSTQSLLDAAPNLQDYLNDESKQNFVELRALLDAAGVPYEVNPRLVRGLDYYSNTVFEWVTSHLGAQGTVCAGGRYDGLVEQLGGKPSAAVGCGMGLERLILLLEELDLVPDHLFDSTDVYLVSIGKTKPQAFLLAETLRTELPELRIVTHMGSGSFKNQMKKADKSNAKVALILGEDEAAINEVGVKPLRTQAEQVQVAFADAAKTIQTLLKTTTQ